MLVAVERPAVQQHQHSTGFARAPDGDARAHAHGLLDLHPGHGTQGLLHTEHVALLDFLAIQHFNHGGVVHGVFAEPVGGNHHGFQSIGFRSMAGRGVTMGGPDVVGNEE